MNKEKRGGKRVDSGRKNKKEYHDKIKIYLNKIDERINKRKN